MNSAQKTAFASRIVAKAHSQFGVRLMDFFDLAGLQTARADRDFLDPTANASPHRTQVRIEASVGQIMGVRHGMTEHRLLAAIIANS